MKNITKTFEEKSYSMSTGFTKDLGLFTVNGTIWSYVNPNTPYKNKYDHEISDIEINYEINGKYCMNAGFKELYEKLYGKDSFTKFEREVAEEFEAAYYETTPYSND